MVQVATPLKQKPIFIVLGQAWHISLSRCVPFVWMCVIFDNWWSAHRRICFDLSVLIAAKKPSVVCLFVVSISAQVVRGRYKAMVRGAGRAHKKGPTEGGRHDKTKNVTKVGLRNDQFTYHGHYPAITTTSSHDRERGKPLQQPTKAYSSTFIPLRHSQFEREHVTVSWCGSTARRSLTTRTAYGSSKRKAATGKVLYLGNFSGLRRVTDINYSNRFVGILMECHTNVKECADANMTKSPCRSDRHT